MAQQMAAQTRLQVFHLLDLLESTTASATKLPLTKRAVINPGEVQELVAKLRHALPNEITDAQQIIRYRDSILSKAQADAKRLREAAEQESLQKISETEIMRDADKRVEEVEAEAQRRAEQLVASAEARIQERIEGADAYAADVLGRLEEELGTLLATARRGLEQLKAGRKLQSRGRR
ncbi:MAG: hypothetical protein V3V35_01655 [Dehalococcoidia bacterium]